VKKKLFQLKDQEFLSLNSPKEGRRNKMYVWNTASKKIEARFDGRIFEFAPNERKNIHNPDAVNHLYMKLEKYGLVLLNDGFSQEDEKKALTDGLKKRWKMLDAKVRGYRTMNKEREAQKMSAEPPSEDIMNCAEEATELLEKMKSLDSDKMKKVEAYLNDDARKDSAESIQNSEQTIQTSGSFETTIGPRRPGRPRKDAAALAGNP